MRNAFPPAAIRDRDLLGATLQVLADAGFSSLNFNGIASRAGLSVGAIERDWNSKLDLVIAAFNAAFEERPVPDTGSFPADCRLCLRETVREPLERRVAAGDRRLCSATRRTTRR